MSFTWLKIGDLEKYMLKEKTDITVSLEDLNNLEQELSRQEKTKFLSKVFEVVPNIATAARKFFDSPYVLPSFMPDYARASYAVKMIQKSKEVASNKVRRHGADLSHIMEANPIWMQLQKNMTKDE